MIRGLSPIPRGGGKPEGKEGGCITTLGAVSPIEGVCVRTKIIWSVSSLGNTMAPSCGFPQKSFPPEGPHDFRGHLRRSRKSDIAAGGIYLGRLCHLPPCAPPEGRTAGARLRTLRAPLGTHTVGACCASAPNKRPSCLRTPRISFARPVSRSISGGLALILACGRELSCRRLARGSVTRTSYSTPPP